MNKAKTFSVKNTFIIVAVLLPIMVLSAIGAAISGLEGINPENHGKTLVFPVGNDAADTVKTIYAFVIVPLSLLMVITAGLNFKIKNAMLNRGLLLLSLFLVLWLVFANWALDARFVAPSESSQAPPSRNRSKDEGDLQIRTINLN